MRGIQNRSAVGVELSRTRKKLVATANRREGVYNRTGEPSVTFCEKGQHFRPPPAADKGRKWLAQRSAIHGVRKVTGESRKPQEGRQRRECALAFIKNRSKRYIACSDVKGANGLEAAFGASVFVRKKKRVRTRIASRLSLAERVGFEPTVP